ncbi:hypothetical protein [Novosphingobium sp. MBES04]|uniref:hypothetical protein n=1 Tax=Novosphingobium sp. MBES04 TaxID=1206458 RepID=UPI00057CF1C7|nr:hypothetical protein [Novosphingobium sp. MBES04]
MQVIKAVLGSTSGAAYRILNRQEFMLPFDAGKGARQMRAATCHPPGSVGSWNTLKTRKET